VRSSCSVRAFQNMNKFNKKRGNATKNRKINQRVVKKRNKVKQKHEKTKVLVSGKRTGEETILLSLLGTVRISQPSHSYHEIALLCCYIAPPPTWILWSYEGNKVCSFFKRRCCSHRQVPEEAGEGTARSNEASHIQWALGCRHG
jgi:hypothetical protein